MEEEEEEGGRRLRHGPFPNGEARGRLGLDQSQENGKGRARVRKEGASQKEYTSADGPRSVSTARAIEAGKDLGPNQLVIRASSPLIWLYG